MLILVGGLQCRKLEVDTCERLTPQTGDGKAKQRICGAVHLKSPRPRRWDGRNLSNFRCHSVPRAW